MKLKKRFLSIVLTICCLYGVCGVSYAGQWSAGVLVGQSSVDDLEDACFGTCTVDDSDTALGINVAYNFSDAWGVELGYMDFGSFGVDGTFTSLMIDYQVEADGSVVYLAGTGTLDLNDKWSLTGRLGIGSLEVDASSSLVSFSEREEELFIGVSADYLVTDSFNLGLRLDNVDDVTAISLAGQFRF